jgi:hypothetical protein
LNENVIGILISMEGIGCFMTSPKRYEKSVNCHMPKKICVGIETLMERDEKIQSEVVRELLELGLRAKGIA